ncbi:tudor domain-containing 6-like [Patiria miniata]|uniref:Tudor domain-containing protein n=1 Tax=Patiria miniata TaxID=46514 RepID=A0A913ZZ49_PATMI|nr:tudor domain-containing 6-like [Patiria miniata]
MGSIARQILKNAGSRIEVYVTAADADRNSGLLKFWTQLDQDGLEQVEQLAERFQFIAQQSASPQPDLLGPGSLCIAKYLEDNRWYRAQIESATGNDVIAFFIDYGNTEIIPRNLVRLKESVGDDVFAIPGQATECVLAGVVAIMQHRHIKMGTHAYLKSTLVDQTFVGEPLQLTNDGLEMKLFTESGDSVSEKFILDEFGERRGPGVPIDAASAPQKQVSRGYNQSTLAVGSCQNLYVSNVASLSQFWVQPASKSEELDNLMDSISAQYDGLGPAEKALGAAQLGSPCVAMFSDDAVNYRAVVTEVKGPKQCTVQFVDFGNSEVKETASLKAITDDLLQYPVIAVECSLSGVSAQSSSLAAVERFEELTAEKELSGKVVGMNGNACCVLILDPQGEENADIISVLVKEGLASRSAEQFNHQAPSGANPGAFNGSGDAGVSKSFIDPRISQGSRVIVEIIAIRGTDDFSCQLMEDAEAFNAMMDRLQADYSVTPTQMSPLRSPAVGKPCCVMFGDDNCWYRALVVSVEGRQIRVQYVDYGNGEVVDASKLMQLKSEYLTLPLQCIDCSLDGVPALEGVEAETAINWLDKHTEENFVATVTSVRGGKFAVVLKSQEAGTILNDEIKKILPRQRTEKKMKTPPRAKPPPEAPRLVQRTPPRNQPLNSSSTSVADLGFWTEVKLGTTETDVYISHVEDPSKFFCQLVSQEGQLNVLMDDIHNKCMDSQLKQLQRACVGTPCVAQFSEDSSWYRGVIKDQKPGLYRVCFVDYGNEEDVPLDKVCEITADLMSLPQQAASCCLSGWDLTWKEYKVIQRMKSLAAEIEKFRMVVRESKGASVVQLKWQGKDMLQELRKVRDSIPKEVKQPPKAATPPRQKERPVDSTPPFTLASAVESVKVDQRVMMAASVAKGPTKFFCQLCSSYDQLQGLSAEMNNHYSASKPSKDMLTSAVPGAFCAAQSSDGAWYRAKILREAGPGKVKVRFVDYGDDDVVAVASLCTLLPKFRNLPTQAIKCRLSGVMQKFESVVVDQEVMATVKSKSDGKLEIEYIDDAFRAKVQEILGPVVQPVQVQGGSPQVVPVPQQGFAKQGMLGGTDQDVYVSHVDNLQKFYVQMCGRSDEIDMLQQKLKTSYNSGTSGPLSSAAVGTTCCAKFSEDGDWYRAVITGSPSPGRVVVQFVDFGNSEEQSASDLRPIKPEFLQPTAGAVACRLKDVGSSSLDIANEFLDLTVDKSMKCMFHGREEPYQVQFPALQDEVKKWQQAAAKEPAMPSASCPAPKTLSVGMKEEVYISSVTSPASFWCQLAQHEGTLNELMDSIDAHYSSLTPGEGQMRSPVVGAVCVAQFADDGGWYRAKVTEVQPETCTVTFIDYGNSDKVSKSLIMDIKEDFLAVEQQAVLCSLGGVGPVSTSWTGEACDSFLNLTGDKKLLAEVVAVEPSASSHQVTLLDLGMSLGQSLIDAGHARSVPVTTKAIRFASESDNLQDALHGFEKLNITQGSTEKVFVTVVNSLHEFYCQMAARATEDLDPLSEKLQSEAPSVDNMQAGSIQGLPCIAKFSDDEQWYRATVLAEKGDTVDVFFIDYGNKESVPRDQIKVLTSDFSSLPAQAVKCALALIPESSASDDAAVAEFENAVLEGEALTAEFISRKGTAWIIRLLNDGEPVAEALGIKLQDEISESAEQALTPRSLSYTWTPLKARQVVEVFVTTVNSPEDFWCQFAKSEDDLNVVMDNIQSLVIPMGENPRPQDMQLRPGHACLAQCTQDGFWYRSEVTEVVGDAVKVLFVDTGKTETVSCSKVRAIEADFLKLPRQSFRCQLAGASPRQQQWDQDAADAFKKMSCDHSLMADILKVVRTEEDAVTRAIVSLQDGAVSLSDLLVEKGLAEAVEVPQYAEEEMEDSVCEQVLEASPWEGPKYEQPTLLSGERQEVVVLSVTSPSEFYCRAADSEESGILATITSEMERRIGEMIGTSRLVPAKGMPCVAKCEDGTWQRVEILDVVPNGKVRTFLVDQALMREVSIDNLQLITSTLLALPLQAVKCSLGATPSGADWSEADTLAFRELVDGKTLQAELGEGGVQLFDEDESVLQTLIRKAEDRNAEILAESQKTPEAGNDNQPEVSNPEEEVSEEEDEIFTEADNLPGSFKQAFETLDLKAGQEITLCLVAVDSPEEITCQIDHEEQKVLDIEQRMTEVYAENTKPLQDKNWVPKVGEPCAAKHSEYDDWYRATVVSVDQEMGVEVFYADYGGTDRVLLESVRELTEDLKRLPAQAMRFCLEKPLMPLTMWNKKTKAIMEGQDTERDLHAKVIEVKEKVTTIELAEEDHTFLTHLVDQSQTSSLDNEEEDGDRDGEFFDAVDQGSTEGDEAYEVADVDSAVKSIPSEAGALVGAGDDVQSSVAAVIDDLFEKAAEQATADQRVSEVQAGDTTRSNNEGSQAGLKQEESATEGPSLIPPSQGGSRMISMKDILDQFVDHTLQNFSKDENDDETQQTDDQEEEDDDDVVEGEEADQLSDDGNEEQEIKEVVNGDVAVDEQTSETNGSETPGDVQESEAKSVPDDTELEIEDRFVNNTKDSDENRQSEVSAMEPQSEERAPDDDPTKEPESIDQQEGQPGSVQIVSTEESAEPQRDELQVSDTPEDSAKETASEDSYTAAPKDGQVPDDQPSINQDSEAEEATRENPVGYHSPDPEVDTENLPEDQDQEMVKEDTVDSLQVDTSGKDPAEDHSPDPVVVTESSSDDHTSASEMVEEDQEGSPQEDTAGKDPVEHHSPDPEVVTESASDDQASASEMVEENVEGSLQEDTATEAVEDEDHPPDDAAEAERGEQTTPEEEQTSAQESSATEKAASDSPDFESIEKQPDFESESND